MLPLYRLLVRPQRVANVLLNSVCSRKRIHGPLRYHGKVDRLTPISDLKTIDDLQRVVMRSRKTPLTPHALLSCLLKLNEMVGSPDREFSPTESSVFHTLSTKFIAGLNSTTHYQVVDFLHVAGNLNVECSSPLVQECCQTLAPKLEEFDLNLLNTLSRALHKFRGTSALTESLMSSSTKIFESQVGKLDLSEFKICFRALEFAVRVNLKRDKRDLVIDTVRVLLPQAHPIYALGLINVVAFERKDSLDPEDHKMHALLNDCLMIIARNISVFRSSQVQQLMTAYSKINIFERELHDALWSLAPSWSLDEIKQLVSLIRAKDAFSSKDARTLLVLLEARGEKIADAQETAETITEDQASLLHRSIDLCKSRKQLRDLIEQNLHGMNSELLFRCVCQYRDLAMIEEGGIAAADDPFFEELASTAASKLDSLNFHKCTVLLRTAKQLKLDDSHVLVQRVLREIPPLIPHMDLNQLKILSGRARKIEGESPLKNDCLLTARLAFERQVKEKLDRTDEEQCLSALEFALRDDLNIEVQNTVIDAAQGFLAHASMTATAEMIYSLVYNKSDFVTVENPKVRDLAENCLTKLAENLNNFDYKTVSRIMGAYKRVDVFSNELNDAFWPRAASLSFHETMRIIFNFPIRKIRLKDADHLKELIVANKDKVRDIDAVRCAHLMALLALSSPGLHSELREIGLLLAEKLFRPNFRIKRAPVLATFVTYLVVLGVFPERELDYLFSEKNQRKILSSRPESGVQLITLERLLRLRFGESCGYAVLPKFREKAGLPQKLWVLDQDLVDIVRMVLGGDQFLSLKVITPIGSEADLVVAKSSDEDLIDLSGKKSPLEDLTEGTRVVGLLQCFRRRYHDDLETRELNFVQREHFLRAQNISPVVVNMVKWKSLPSRKERDSFLMRKIEDAMREAPPYKQQRFWKSP